MNLFSSLTTMVTTVSTSIFVLMVVICGIMIAVKMNKGDGFRESAKSLGTVMLGVVITSGATALVAFGTWVGQQIK